MNLLQTKHELNLVRWQAIVTECRDSGIPIRTWCRNNQINIKTYYYWQRKVWDRNFSFKDANMVSCHNERSNPTFVEYKLPDRTATNIAVTVRLEYAVLEIHNGADELAVASAMRALKSYAD